MGEGRGGAVGPSRPALRARGVVGALLGARCRPPPLLPPRPPPAQAAPDLRLCVPEPADGAAVGCRLLQRLHRGPGGGEGLLPGRRRAVPHAHHHARLPACPPRAPTCPLSCPAWPDPGPPAAAVHPAPAAAGAPVAAGHRLGGADPGRRGGGPHLQGLGPRLVPAAPVGGPPLRRARRRRRLAAGSQPPRIKPGKRVCRAVPQLRAWHGRVHRATVAPPALCPPAGPCSRWAWCWAWWGWAWGLSSAAAGAACSPPTATWAWPPRCWAWRSCPRWPGAPSPGAPGAACGTRRTGAAARGGAWRREAGRMMQGGA